MWHGGAVPISTGFPSQGGGLYRSWGSLWAAHGFFANRHSESSASSFPAPRSPFAEQKNVAKRSALSEPMARQLSGGPLFASAMVGQSPPEGPCWRRNSSADRFSQRCGLHFPAMFAFITTSAKSGPLQPGNTSRLRSSRSFRRWSRLERARAPAMPTLFVARAGNDQGAPRCATVLDGFRPRVGRLAQKPPMELVKPCQGSFFFLEQGFRDPERSIRGCGETLHGSLLRCLAEHLGRRPLRPGGAEGATSVAEHRLRSNSEPGQ